MRVYRKKIKIKIKNVELKKNSKISGKKIIMIFDTHFSHAVQSMKK